MYKEILISFSKHNKLSDLISYLWSKYYDAFYVYKTLPEYHLIGIIVQEKMTFILESQLTKIEHNPRILPCEQHLVDPVSLP